MNHEKLSQIAREEAHAALQNLPDELRATVEPVPVFFETVPDADDLAYGIAPDTLGLFDPGTDEAALPRIRLWLSNLWDFAEEDEVVFRDEVRITLLHEIGHLLGWDEDEIDERGLG